MSPPPFDLNDWFETESDSELSGSDSEEEDSEGSIPQDDGDEDWEDERDSGHDDDGSEESDSEEDDGEDYKPAKGIIVPPLLPIPASIKKPDQSLCQVCKKLKLTPRRFVVLPGDPETGNEADDPNIDLGLLEDITKKSTHCPFCRLVLAALGPGIPLVGEDGAKSTVKMSWNTDGSWLRRPQNRILRPTVETTKGGYIKTAQLFPEITMLAADAPPGKRTKLIRVIKDQIDWGMVRNWLNICRIQHGSACDESKMMEHQIKDPAREIPYFRLIDVVDNCIIPAPRGAKYVALSYVWGRIDPTKILRSLLSNYKDLEQPGVLLRRENLDRMPITIQDAMQAVRELKLRYLWVDSLCIIQDDAAPGGSKMSSISKMDIVYGAAYLTIWAATGSDANAGLPGLRPNTRGISQPMEEVLPNLRLGYKTKLPDFAMDAIYYTRAWTYQEQRFTKRSLVFIGGQVVFTCAKGNQWREDILFEDGKIEENPPMPYDGDDIGELEGLIQNYSGLSLTYDSDIYHAFAGFNNYLKVRLRSTLVHGIPDAFFDWALLWHPLGVQQRRDKTPSWSWSGWVGQSWPHMWDWYNRSIIRIRSALRTRTWIIWYQRKSHDSEEVVRIWTPKKSSKPTSRPRNFYGGHVKERFPIDCSQTVPTPRKLIGAPQYIEDSHNPTPGSGFLQFWTVSLVFKLGKSRSKAGEGPANANTRFGIYGRSNRELGVVYLHPEWAKANLGKDHEFIVLCEGRDKRAEYDEIDEEEGWRYKVMLIEWKGDWAVRVSVGSIGKNDLQQSAYGPQWKEIILG